MENLFLCYGVFLCCLNFSQILHFRLFPTERVCRRLFLNLLKMAESSPKRCKTLWEKKLLVMSNFSFSHSVFKRFVLQVLKNKGLFEKELILYQRTSVLTTLKKKAFENIAGNWHFLLFPPCFLPFQTKFVHLRV